MSDDEFANALDDLIGAGLGLTPAERRMNSNRVIDNLTMALELLVEEYSEVPDDDDRLGSAG